MKKLLSFILTLAMMVSISSAMAPTKTYAATTSSKTNVMKNLSIEGVVNYSKISVMSEPSWKSTKKASLPLGTNLTIDERFKFNNAYWYHVTATVKGKYVSGYANPNYILTNTKMKLTGTVNYREISIMSSPSWSSKKITGVKSGTKLTIDEKIKVGSAYWYHVTAVVNGKTYSGYSNPYYIAVKSEINMPGTVDYPKISVMTSASWNSKRIGYIKDGAKVTILESIDINSTRWYKVKATVNGKSVIGYSCSNFIQLTLGSGCYAITRGTVKYRKSANSSSYATYGGKIISSSENAKVWISKEVTVNGTKWFRISKKFNGVVYYGYVLSNELSICEKKNSTSTEEEGPYIGHLIEEDPYEDTISGEDDYEDTDPTPTPTPEPSSTVDEYMEAVIDPKKILLPNIGAAHLENLPVVNGTSFGQQDGWVLNGKTIPILDTKEHVESLLGKPAFSGQFVIIDGLYGTYNSGFYTDYETYGIEIGYGNDGTYDRVLTMRAFGLDGKVKQCNIANEYSELEDIDLCPASQARIYISTFGNNNKISCVGNQVPYWDYFHSYKGLTKLKPNQCLKANEEYLEFLVNLYRQRYGCSPLTHDDGLSEFATAHTEDTIKYGYEIRHNGPNGETAYERIAKIPYSGVGENLTSCDSTVEGVLLWAGSPGHNQNLLNPNFTLFGGCPIFEVYKVNSTDYMIGGTMTQTYARRKK